MKENLQVAVYSTPTCPYCIQLKTFLKEKGITYKDINVAEDHKAAQEMIKKSGQMGVPVMIVQKNGKEEIVVGFNKERVKSILGLK